jgi:hypothetical protein
MQVGNNEQTLQLAFVAIQHFRVTYNETLEVLVLFVLLADVSPSRLHRSSYNDSYVKPTKRK